MSWRTVVISERAKLELQLGNLVIRGNETKKIHISEIAVLIIESTAVSLTAALMSELTRQRVKIILCDANRNPQSEIIPYYGVYNSSAKIKEQLSWNKTDESLIWTAIIRQKINNQRINLIRFGFPEYAYLDRYLKEIKYRDKTNREGLASKIYFRTLFGDLFSRSEDSPINAALNYGYSIILSAFNREITANGYMTQLGLFHDNMFNAFNLGSDLMEPYRPLIDRIVFKMQPEEFGKDEKQEILKVLEEQFIIDGMRQYLLNGIHVYCKSVFNALNESNPEVIKFYSL